VFKIVKKTGTKLSQTFVMQFAMNCGEVFLKIWQKKVLKEFCNIIFHFLCQKVVKFCTQKLLELPVREERLWNDVIAI
jgi:hypothetical protein